VAFWLKIYPFLSTAHYFLVWKVGFLVLFGLVWPPLRFNYAQLSLHSMLRILFNYSVLKHCAHIRCTHIVCTYSIRSAHVYYIGCSLYLHRVHSIIRCTHVSCTLLINTRVCSLRSLYSCWKRAPKRNLVSTYVGPKGPGLMKKYPAVAGYLMKMEQSSTKDWPD
jgi:hypothetical protein